MIDLNFGLWWAGSKLSYLRFLTFKTLRHFHPRSRIQLFVPFRYKKKSNLGVDQEFNNPDAIAQDYKGELLKLNVEIVPVDKFSDYAPNFQSDLFRWWYLDEYGGFYLDTDQIILRSFKGLPVKKHDFIYSSYSVESSLAPDGQFSPVGVIGSSKGNKIVKNIRKKINEHYNADDYNSMGPWMFAKIVKNINGFNAPSHYFYPAPIGDYTSRIYNGTLEIKDDNYSLHWFGGYSPSQEFNVKYTKEFAKKSNDTISKFLRERKLL